MSAIEGRGRGWGVVGNHSRQGNTGRPRSEAAKLESKLDDSWIASLQSRGFFLLLHAAPTLPPPSAPGPDSGKSGSEPRAPY